MSALAGLWNFSGKPDAAQSCRRMLTAQQIYGPHGTADWDGGGVSLGRRIFKTLPEDAFDRQPLSGGGGRFRLVADLRLDNRAELASELGISPSDARRLADSGILLRAWERWEEAALDRLYGDYAFAVWDERDRRLILARDALGARPLHYHVGRDFAAFATMPKGLHALADIPYAPDEERMAEFLALMPEHGTRSFFEGVSRVQSGHVVTITRDNVSVRRHWQPSRGPLKLSGPDEYAEALREQLDRAVEARLRGVDGMVGAHLSAGWDSSSVAATAARLLAPRQGKVLAFTSVPREGYDGPAPPGRFGDEGELAAATAALYPNIEHVLMRPDQRSIMDNLERDFFLFDRPILNACNQKWASAINSEAQRRGVKVLLSGAMGNLTLTYNGMELLPELARRGRFIRLLREGRALVRGRYLRWTDVFKNVIGPWMPEQAWLAMHRLARAKTVDVSNYTALNPERREALDMDARAREHGFALSYKPRTDAFALRLWALRRVDLGNPNKGALGGWGIDMRDPTSDRRLVEFCLALPTEAYLEKGKPRALARRALADRLPPQVLAERRKGLQAIDWHEGLTASRDQIREEIERLEQVPAAAAALDLPKMRALVENWPEGEWASDEVISNYRLALLRGVSSGNFLRKASRSNA